MFLSIICNSKIPPQKKKKMNKYNETEKEREEL